MIMSLSSIAAVIKGKLSAGACANREISGFYTDSRNATDDKLFLALRGERVDGNSFVPALVSKGFAVMTDDESNLSLNGDIIYVDDVRSALQLLAKYYRETVINSIPMVGITGSVGKTTTKDMVSLALSATLKVHKTQGNFNSQVGLPQTVLATPKDVDCAVVELGMSMKGEMERIARCAMPDISIITNIGYSHIENLGTREAIKDEKLKIAEFSKRNSILLLNGDEPLLKNSELSDRCRYFVSVNDDKCDCYAKGVTETTNGVLFTACVFGKEIAVELHVKGKHFILNALFALGTCHLLGVDIYASAKMLASYESDGKRQHIFEKEGHTVISDCYNASPESMKAALDVLSAQKGRRIAVLGDMLELGTESERLHKLVGEYTNGCADVLVTYGEFSKFINQNAVVVEKYHFDLTQKKDLGVFLKDFIRFEDVVLYKASNGINLSEIIV
ncbi:MAG: UDP-N-acetylmuramoyl-tripeptide--D-alanyl-D-alanine ligase [Ruminococcaceae bacterium]|nr:UDP-N-acetylmuramoyl-tripeptide--D-alanyl-D-alanine ligase [Oscillospiraceae bacterium]